jgi:SAM-dependent methyltransferase
MQPPDEIEFSYTKEDPWGFKTNPDDQIRKNKIIQICKRFAPTDSNYIFERALDLGCGEGWITADLPAMRIFGYELSKQAKARFPKNVVEEDIPNGLYDLVLATGVLYQHYDYKLFMHLIKNHAGLTLVTCNIKAWECDEIKSPEIMSNAFKLKQIYAEEFPYREYVQKLRVFEKL